MSTREKVVPSVLAGLDLVALKFLTITLELSTSIEIEGIWLRILGL